MQQLRILFSASNTRLPRLERLTLVFNIHVKFRPQAYSAFLPFEQKSCLYLPSALESDIESLSRVQPRYESRGDYLLTTDVAPRLQHLCVDLQGHEVGKETVLIYPSSVFMTTLWDRTREQKLDFSAPTKMRVVHIG
jgi:hypothetical protein